MTYIGRVKVIHSKIYIYHWGILANKRSQTAIMQYGYILFMYVVGRNHFPSKKN